MRRRPMAMAVDNMRINLTEGSCWFLTDRDAVEPYDIECFLYTGDKRANDDPDDHRDQDNWRQEPIEKAQLFKKCCYAILF